MINVSETAASKITELLIEEQKAGGGLRVFVQGGGCSGFQYGFTFDEIVNDDDTAMAKNGVTLLIDAMSLQYLAGAEIDYKDDLQGAQFVIKNPNATTTCGCGSSFQVKEDAAEQAAAVAAEISNAQKKERDEAPPRPAG